MGYAEKYPPPFFLGAEQIGFELVEKLFQGQLVLRTRCLECESLTERREDFQDISVPVQEDELSKVEESSESKQNWSLVWTCVDHGISSFLQRNTVS